MAPFWVPVYLPSGRGQFWQFPPVCLWQSSSSLSSIIIIIVQYRPTKRVNTIHAWWYRFNCASENVEENRGRWIKIVESTTWLLFVYKHILKFTLDFCFVFHCLCRYMAGVICRGLRCEYIPCFNSAQRGVSKGRYMIQNCKAGHATW